MAKKIILGFVIATIVLLGSAGFIYAYQKEKPNLSFTGIQAEDNYDTGNHQRYENSESYCNEHEEYFNDCLEEHHNYMYRENKRIQQQLEKNDCGEDCLEYQNQYSHNRKYHHVHNENNENCDEEDHKYKNCNDENISHGNQRRNTGGK